MRQRRDRVARPHDAGPELKPRFYGSGFAPSPPTSSNVVKKGCLIKQNTQSLKKKEREREKDRHGRKFEIAVRRKIWWKDWGWRGLYASGYAHTMERPGEEEPGESKSGELIVARAADEAAAICGA